MSSRSRSHSQNNSQSDLRKNKVGAEERLFKSSEIEAKEMEIDDTDDYNMDENVDYSIEPTVPLMERVLANRPTYSSTKAQTMYFITKARCTISLTYDDIMMIVTMFVLFEEDFRYLCLPKSADGAFEVMVSISFVLFLLELVLNSWAKTEWKPKNGSWVTLPNGYLLSFFFWLDLLAILSLFPDVPWIAKPLGIVGISNPVRNEGGSRFGSIGTKAGRVLRMVRLVRLVRIYKIAMNRRQEKKLYEEMEEQIAKGAMDPDEAYRKVICRAKQSKVGAELSDTTMRRVITGVFLMICLVPLLTYHEVDKTETDSVEMLHSFNTRNVSTDLDIAVSRLTSSLKTYSSGEVRLLRLEMQPGERIFLNNETSEYRDVELSEVSQTSQEGQIEFVTLAVFSLKPLLFEAAYLGMLLTCFVLFMLVIGVLTFNADAQRLVLAPIERMMEIVEAISEDPLTDFDHMQKEEEVSGKAQTGEYETRLLENTITKITGLLRVGFGVAGAEIISKNISITDSSSTMLDPMVPGKRVYAIIGFCDIHKFELVTERLFGEVMTFVNCVAEIVHESTSKWAGACNKNLGNAFVIVWRIGDEEEVALVTQRARIDGNKKRHHKAVLHTQSSVATAGAPSNDGRQTAAPSPAPNAAAPANTAPASYVPKIDLRRIPGLDVLADKAVIGFLKIIVEINRNKETLRWKKNVELSKGLPGGFKVRMGFGLHCGWAIEGAVGSQHKVDATYLSPHVNMAARMETASRQYGTPILLTEAVHELLTQEGKVKCRKIDVVTVKGSNEPIPIYTYDCHQEQAFPAPFKPPPRGSLVTNTSLLPEEDMEVYTPNIWDTDQDLRALRQHTTEEFDKIFKEGMNAYIQGEWEKARAAFENCNALKEEIGGDGPSKTLLQFMDSHNFDCPPTWKGFRPLTNK
mmetsp:Transcript_7346/g.9166  ORF Transcript_7346/g.9166 Transcript_7346/m.9166 type:complete len:915 (+) Transcript_7346:148-2892(+)